MLYAQTATHMQHIVICNSFTVTVTTVLCLFVKLVVLMCYCNLKLIKSYNKNNLIYAVCDCV